MRGRGNPLDVRLLGRLRKRRKLQWFVFLLHSHSRTNRLANKGTDEGTHKDTHKGTHENADKKSKQKSDKPTNRFTDVQPYGAELS
jgi:hypothetical protein